MKKDFDINITVLLDTPYNDGGVFYFSSYTNHADIVYGDYKNNIIKECAKCLYSFRNGTEKYRIDEMKLYETLRDG